MPNFEQARRNMVDCQLRTCEVTSIPVLTAFDSVPRERFVPDALRDVAYLDAALDLGAGRQLVPPMTLGRIVQAAAISRTERVLDVGCGLGYSTAILAHLAGDVTGLEEDAGLAAQAEGNLRALGLSNARIVAGPLGAPPAGKGPFDVIIINGGFEEVPAAFLPAVVEGGRLVGVSRANGAGKVVILTKTDGAWSERPLYNASAALLPAFRRAPAFAF
ncbi:MAG: protein-L-isoaspartate O-methyltransferase family protein [Beijerinckiaceae bacterium]